MKLRYFIYILLFLTLSCVKEDDVLAPEENVTATIQYSAVVHGSQLTRASISGDFGLGSYIFQTGDRLFIVDTDTGGDNLSGVLKLVGGADSDQGYFAGELNYFNGFEPSADDETALSATLVGPDALLYTISGDRITETTYPSYPSSSIDYEPGGLAEYVKKYSNFTSSSTLGAKSFTLTQQTVFLNFNIFLPQSSLTGSPSTVDVNIKSSDGSSILHKIRNVPVGGTSYLANLEFTMVFPEDEDTSSLKGAQIVVDNGGGIRCEPDFASTLDLKANKYYAVTRTINVEPFTVEAISNETTITCSPYFKTNTQYNKCSDGVWAGWTSTPTDPIKLSKGGKVSFRGTNTCYGSGSDFPPLFTTNKAVNIYGDIMSLMCDVIDENWVPKSTVGNNSLKQAFKGVNVNIPNDKELILSAVTLGTSCYQSMFENCTNLTKAPIIVSITTVENSACKMMFKGCTSLKIAPEFNSISEVKDYGCSEMFNGCTSLITPPPCLPATTLRDRAYNQMFMGCKKLTYTPSFPGKKGTLSGIQNFYQMFNECTELITTSGKLFTSDTYLRQECFHGMFRHCYKLANVPYDFLPSTHLAMQCYRGMFEGAAFETAPELPATSLVTECYRYMFYGCANLNFIKCLATNPNNGTYTPNWVTNVGSSGTFYKSSVTQVGGSGPNDTKWPKYAINGIPSKWDWQDAE